MIQEYSKFIGSLVKSIANSDNNFTWLNFIDLMKNSIVLVLFLLFMTFGLYGIFYFIPITVYKKTVGIWVAKLGTVFDAANDNFNEYINCKNRVLKYRIMYAVFMLVVYIPLVLPILLMTINVLF